MNLEYTLKYSFHWTGGLDWERKLEVVKILLLNFVPNTSCKYIAYTDGRIYSIRANRFLEASLNNGGYCETYLNYTNRKGTRLWHRIIAHTFIPNTENKPQINHIDANKENNRVENLEWATPQENMNHVAKNRLNPRSTWVCLLNEERDIIRIFETISIAGRELKTKHHDVIHSCNGNIDKTKGFRLRYYDENEETYIKTRFDKVGHQKRKSYRRKVYCNETSQAFVSHREAGRVLNISAPRIAKFLRNEINDVDGFTFKEL